jgi:hypothetical protein
MNDWPPHDPRHAADRRGGDHLERDGQALDCRFGGLCAGGFRG